MRRLRGRPFGSRTAPSCKDVALVLQTYLDGEIAEQDREAVERHLDACKDCGLEAETFEAVKAALADRRTPIDISVIARLHSFADELIADAPGPS